MRIRTIKPEFFKHDELAELPPLIRLLFIGLWCVADCEGRLEDRPARIRAEVLPYDKCDVPAALEQLAAKGFIVRYQTSGINLIHINGFRKHQRITGKEAETRSRFPSPFPALDVVDNNPTREAEEQHEGNNGETPETTGREGKGKEGKGKERSNTPRSRAGRVVAPVGSLIPAQQPELIFRRMLAINALKRRSDGTSWTAKEFAAFKAVGLHEIPDEDFAAQIDPLADYYGAEVASLREMWRTTDPGADFRRRDLLTLLNNFAGEVDRAREWTKFCAEKNAARDAGRL